MAREELDEAGEKGLCETGTIGVEVIVMAADLPLPDGQRNGVGAFGGRRVALEK